MAASSDSQRDDELCVLASVFPNECVIDMENKVVEVFVTVEISKKLWFEWNSGQEGGGVEPSSLTPSKSKAHDETTAPCAVSVERTSHGLLTSRPLLHLVFLSYFNYVDAPNSLLWF